MELSGRTLIGAELGAKLGVSDLDGSAPKSYRSELGGPPELQATLTFLLVSGVLPMNHSNKIEQSMAEGEEGRPLIKENTHQASTRPTQSGQACHRDWRAGGEEQGENKRESSPRLLSHCPPHFLPFRGNPFLHNIPLI